MFGRFNEKSQRFFRQDGAQYHQSNPGHKARLLNGKGQAHNSRADNRVNEVGGTSQ